MLTVNPHYITDKKGKKISVVLPIKDFNALMHKNLSKKKKLQKKLHFFVNQKFEQKFEQKLEQKLEQNRTQQNVLIANIRMTRIVHAYNFELNKISFTSYF